MYWLLLLIAHAQFTCTVHMHSSHAQFTCKNILPLSAYDRLRLRCLPNPSQSDIWWLTTARKDFCQHCLVWIYCDCTIIQVWLPLSFLFMTC